MYVCICVYIYIYIFVYIYIYKERERERERERYTHVLCIESSLSADDLRPATGPRCSGIADPLGACGSCFSCIIILALSLALSLSLYLSLSLPLLLIQRLHRSPLDLTHHSPITEWSAITGTCASADVGSGRHYQEPGASPLPVSVKQTFLQRRRPVDKTAAAKTSNRGLGSSFCCRTARQRLT